ncbi:MAG: HEAT repeat domain-containing protein [Deltaproteobacteria bacterium]|nr:HEAT repeat domain-containing protein [Deltaproteobacteria bacterium]MBI3388295.1 HEAT repeat domain-containing protein [Deltaproteobacteria bacterium]
MMRQAPAALLVLTMVFVPYAPDVAVPPTVSNAPPAIEPSYDGKPLAFWMQALTDADSKNRVAAASALAKIGPPAKSAVGPLIRALGDEEKLVRTSAMAALGKIGPSAVEAMPALIELLQENDWATRSVASAALAAIQGKPLPESDARDRVPSSARPHLVHRSV